MQQKKPKVSIVVPIYNTEQYLETCVKSIAGGALQDIEIILVNDGSEGNAKQMCENFANDDNRIRVLNKKNEGISKAVFDGINMSSGEYIGFVDSDDYVNENMFQSLFNKAKELDADIVQCGFNEFKGNKTTRTFFSNQLKIFNGNIEEQILEAFFETTASVAPFDNCRWNKLFRATVLKESIKDLPPNLSMGEDLIMFISALNNSEKVVVLKQEINYFYRVIESSFTKKFNEKLIVETMKMLDEIERIAINQKRQGKSLETERNRHIAMLIHFCIESNYNQIQKLETIKRLKNMLSKKEYLLEFLKKQPLMGKVSYISIYLGLERLILMLKR